MCGIAGWIGATPGEEGVAGRMLMALRHRGPDGQGMRSWPQATLLHTRLSIIDLTSAGAQPIANEDGTVWAVFNGEIYNHRELRRDLETRGHTFKGRSDSEVLPHLYEEDGSGFISKLRGMFALAIFDTRAKILILARDRFGIKPLFFAPSANRLAFASEIRALLTWPDIDTRPNRQAIYDFTALSYIPSPETFYTGIKALEPGQMLEGQLGPEGLSWKTRRYHEWSITPDYGLTFDQATERAEALLAGAVHRQMESDVPIGSLLSGGIDSSLVSVVAQQTGNQGIRTFNVRFPESEYDETWAALAVARHIGSRHETLEMDRGRGSWNEITNLLRHAGQPFADTSLFAVHAVCRLMRKHVTVALSGDGGDEGFGGYQLYWQIARIARMQYLPVSILRSAAVLLGGAAKYGLVPERVPHRIGELASADDIAIVQNLFCWVREEEQSQLCLDEGKVLPIRRLFEPQWKHGLPKGASRLERLSAYATEANVRVVLPNDFLFKVDTASMKESLEVRVPMLDEDLFEFGLTLPHCFKVKGRTCKRVLRAVAERQLPREVSRKPKKGFSIPLDTWVDSTFKAQLSDALLGPTSWLPEFFRPESYRPMIEAFCKGIPHPTISRQGLYQRAIIFLALHLALSSEQSS